MLFFSFFNKNKNLSYVRTLPHTYLMHCPQWWMNAYMHEKEEREGKILPQSGDSGGGRIGPSIATQSKYCGLWRNPRFMTSFLFTCLLSPNWIGSCMILSWKLFLLYDQSWNIILESLWSIPWSNKKIVTLWNSWFGFKSQFWFKSWFQIKKLKFTFFSHQWNVTFENCWFNFKVNRHGNQYWFGKWI